MTEDDIKAALERFKPNGATVILNDDTREKLAVPRGKSYRWPRLAKLIASRPWTEVQLLDVKGNIIEVLTKRDDLAAVDLEPVSNGNSAGLPALAGIASLISQTVTHAIREVSKSQLEIIRHLKTEARSEVSDALVAYKDLAREAFTLAFEQQEARRQAEAELLLSQREQVNASAPEAQRERDIIDLLKRELRDDDEKDPTGGMPGGGEGVH